MSEDDYLVVKNYALRLLSVRPRSIAEINAKLAFYVNKKHFSKDLIQKVVSHLEELKYLDDVEFANWWFTARNKTSIRGNQAIKYELIGKGISKEIIDTILRDQDKDIEYSKAEILLKKQITKIPKNAGNREIKAKIYAYLFRRGFKSDVANRVIDEYLKNDKIDKS